MQDRREHSRVIFRREIFLDLDDGHSCTCIGRDFSMTGMGLLTDEQIEEGSTVQVTFHLSGQESLREINMRAQVVYSYKDSDQFRIGISFS